ncbi:hypothetical protein SDC9_155274 [bioreactor metagenome]|uniref:Uncharacterized protein n=1 Tax=bioreactor metagenome TaxID=1076179 RepID=A0A645F0Z7_9ZZZZ
MLLAHHVSRLIDALGGGIAWRDFHAARVVQQAVGQLADLVGEGRGEQQVLTLFGQEGEYFADVADEAHVEHAVGFVEYEDLHTRQVERTLAGVIEQASRSGHQDVHALFQGTDLRVDVDPTEHHHRTERQVFAIGLHRLFDLRRELTGGGQDQAAWPARRMRMDMVLRQQMQ